MKTIAALFTALLLFAVPLHAQTHPVLDRIQAFVIAYNAGDGAAVAGFYAPGAAILPPAEQIVTGQEAISKHYQTAFDGGVGDLNYTIRDFQDFGNLVNEIGISEITAGENRIIVRSFRVWLKLEDTWMLSRDTYQVLGRKQ